MFLVVHWLASGCCIDQARRTRFNYSILQNSVNERENRRSELIWSGCPLEISSHRMKKFQNVFFCLWFDSGKKTPSKFKQWDIFTLSKQFTHLQIHVIISPFIVESVKNLDFVIALICVYHFGQAISGMLPSRVPFKSYPHNKHDAWWSEKLDHDNSENELHCIDLILMIPRPRIPSA